MALWRARAASSTVFNSLLRCSTATNTKGATAHRALSTNVDINSSRAITANQFNFDINSQLGLCMPLAALHIGAKVHNIEMCPGQGGKLVRAPGTYATILKEPSATRCLVKLPSQVEKWIDSQCRATIGSVPSGPNPGNKPKKLYKAGQNRWLGRRPKVRGVAMNPVDHPHGGGEGKSKSSGRLGRCSVTPWGKPTKSGYKTGPLKRRR